MIFFWRPHLSAFLACDAGSHAYEADNSQDISRPKLSETLQRVGFSPRRPRSGHSRGPQPVPHEVPESTQRQVGANTSRRGATSRARKATVSFDTTATPIRRHASQPVTIHPHVSVQPPTPSTSGSRFTKMARGLVRDVRQAQEQEKSNRSRIHLPDVTGLTNAVISPAKANLERYSVRGPGSKEVEGNLTLLYCDENLIIQSKLVSWPHSMHYTRG